MKVFYDTCVYIDFLRYGKHHELFVSKDQVRYLSAVVFMELKAGASLSSQKKGLESLFKTYEKADRIIVPTLKNYGEAGKCLSRLMTGGNLPHKGFTHDLLIALTARSLGATLFTSNHNDFQKIQKLFPFSVVYL